MAFNNEGKPFPIKQRKQTIFIKENVFNEIISFVNKEMREEWKAYELYNIEDVYPNLYYQNIELFPEKAGFMNKKKQMELIEEKIPGKLKELKDFCKLIMFCEKTRIDLRNAIYGKGMSSCTVKEFKLLKGILDKEFKEYLKDKEF